MKRLWIALVLSFASLASAQAASVIEVAAAKSPAFAAAFQGVGLAGILKAPGPYTLFVPSDAAFAKLSDKIKKDPDRLRAVLSYHIVPEKKTAAEMAKRGSAKTVNGEELKVSSENGKFMVEKFAVDSPELAASNGLVYFIDGVLMP